MITPIQPTTNLSAQAYELIKAAIVSGQLEPGELYSVSFLADLLQVSRTPVREALVKLVSEGLLEAVRNRGFRVAVMTERDLDEILEIRIMLEVPAIVRLAQRPSPPIEILAQARDDYIKLQAAADAGELLNFLNLDRQFHINLIASVGNTRLTTLIGELRDHMQLPGLKRIASSGLLADSGREHFTLIEAIEARDPVRAEAVLQAHLARTRAEWS